MPELQPALPRWSWSSAVGLMSVHGMRSWRWISEKPFGRASPTSYLAWEVKQDQE